MTKNQQFSVATPPQTKKAPFRLQNLESVNRITTLPIVESGWHIAGNMYNKIKVRIVQQRYLLMQVSRIPTTSFIGLCNKRKVPFRLQLTPLFQPSLCSKPRFLLLTKSCARVWTSSSRKSHQSRYLQKWYFINRHDCLVNFDFPDLLEH